MSRGVPLVFLSILLSVVRSDLQTVTTPFLSGASSVEGGFAVDLQTRHGVFRERGMLQKRSGTLDIEGAVREVG